MEMTPPLLQLPNTFRAFYGRFVQLHPIQKEAISPILAGRDLVLQSATGSGKTEAVLAPCVERLIRSGGAGALLYVVPTRALALDIERRLAPVLIDRLGLQFGIRTGDAKRAGGSRPDLILTTPESLDVLLGRTNAEWRQFVRRVQTVIIDEVHPLLHQYRGRHLSCLLNRIERRTDCRVQKIALSATIADVDAVVRFFGFREDTVRLLGAVQRDIESHLVYLRRDDELVGLLEDLYRLWGYRKILMFANSRGQCDRLFALANREGPFRGVAEIHFSNLRLRERRAAEQRFRRRNHALCVATSTLELGIDVGDVDAVVLFEPPDSVSAFLQRIGRSNRRGGTSRFWGICRGERSGDQLLRFAGLLRLAGQGSVEIPPKTDFPSVLVQQVLSCLYEKKTLSLPALRALFPQERQVLDEVVPSMERLGWLRSDRLSSFPRPAASGRLPGPDREARLFHGGWRYRDALISRKIWSNFPETEEDYLLEISGEVVADLPRSVVRQLEAGDCVHLAGRRVCILGILRSAEGGRVLAEPCEEPGSTEVSWVGVGSHVPFEVAQSMGAVLDGSEGSPDPGELGLFARTRRLFREQQEKARRCIVLANGIEVLKEPNGFFRYRTFLGTLGNLVLRLTVESRWNGREDFCVSSDELGITCSHWIDFQQMPLPRNREEFRQWVSQRVRSLRALMPLNAFADALPDGLLVDEVAGMLYDPRVSEAFARFRSIPSEIIRGDPRILEFPKVEAGPAAPVFLQSSVSVSLLAREKERRAVDREAADFVPSPDARHIPRAVTGAMIGEYLRLRQCERWLSFQFLPPDQRPPRRGNEGADLDGIRMDRGRRHEERVLEFLHQRGELPHMIRTLGEHGRVRSIEERFAETLDWLAHTIHHPIDGRPGLLFRATLLASSFLSTHGLPELFREPPDMTLLDGTHAVGVLDLVRVSHSPEGVRLEVGDIKDSAVPHLSGKWRVAFHALLLQDCLDRGLLPPTCRLSGTGFLILRPDREGREPVVHTFDLLPFLAAFPALLHQVGTILSHPPTRASYRLSEDCTPCGFFWTCYGQAINEEDIQFLPGLREGELWKLRQLGLSTIENAGKWFELSTNGRQPEGDKSG